MDIFIIDPITIVFIVSLTVNPFYIILINQIS